MKKITITFTILFVSLTAFSQTSDSLSVQQQSIRQLTIDLNSLRVDFINQLTVAKKNLYTDFAKHFSAVNDSIQSLQLQIEIQKQTIAVLTDSLGIKMSENTQNTNVKIASVNKSIGNKTLFGIISGVVLLLFSIALFMWLFKTQKTSKAEIIGRLEKTKSSVEEKLIKEFAKQTEIMESLTKTLQATPTVANADIDHSLALKLADEITLMERNISFMDGNTRGLKQLVRSIGKLKDNLAANGYEIPELLGKTYNTGMKAIITNTIQDDNLDKDVELITKIVKPQVNYKDVMIQAAQIEVSIG
jgi:hypothetical protein